jgi:aminoglycoside phosphotransferase (APT) family kinase protein
MTELQERWDRLAYWLGPQLGADGVVTISDGGVPDGIGYSAETLIFTANVPTPDGDEARKLVLRAETPDPAVYPAQVEDIDVEIEIQHRLMSALATHTDIPVAPIVGSDLTDEAIGTPFFVMEFVDGVVPSVDPPYPAAGFFADAAPADRARMVANGVQVMADVHAVDWDAAGLDWLVPAGAAPTLARQLDLWEAYARHELRDRVHPDMETALDLLRRHLDEPSEPTLCWGDPRLGNIIWKDFGPVSVTDWEAAAIAPAELDLGWWLMFDRSCHEVGGFDRLEGEPTREEQRDLYAQAVGRDVGDTHLYELLAAYRYSAIVVRVMNRWVERGAMPADHTIWLENPAADCLRQLLAA